MAKSMKNPRRERAKTKDDRIALVEEALNKGLTTRKEICKATGLKMTDLAKLFTDESNLYAKYKIARRTIVDQAADNIHAIVNDKTHPQHFAASKYVLQNYKSDLDDSLESADSEAVQIETSIDSDNKGLPVKIVFSHGKRGKEE